MKVVVILFMIWTNGYAKNILDSHQTQQDLTAGGGNFYSEYERNEICSDSSDYPWRQHCYYWKIYCTSNASVKKFCMKTCDSCRNVNSQDLECAKVASEKATARVGGPNACQVKPHSKPWTFHIRRCGGTLISKRVVLTAGHCICKHDCSPESTEIQRRIGKYVTVGEHDTENDFESGDQKIKIEKVAIHNKWTGISKVGQNTFDVALIFLEKDARLGKDVQIASLPQNDEKCPPGNVLTLAGWGDDPYLNEPHHILWAVKQECLDISGCNRFSNLGNDRPVLCVGDKNDPRNSGFRGDSGGPLTYTDKDGKTTVFGIVSGPGGWKNHGKSTAAFTRVSYPGILHWIKRTMESTASYDY